MNSVPPPISHLFHPYSTPNSIHILTQVNNTDKINSFYLNDIFSIFNSFVIDYWIPN